MQTKLEKGNDIRTDDQICNGFNATSHTSHEEKQASHVMHEALIPAATQQSYCPPKQDDGQSHAHESCCHPAQI